MKKILAMICLGLALGFTGCATTQPDATQSVTTVLTTTGTALSKVPGTMDSLYTSGLVTKEQYNKTAVLYMQVKAAYILVVDAQEMNLLVGSADSQAKYDAAYASLLKLNSDLTALLVSFTGGK
jgi:hypothetical protein